MTRVCWSSTLVMVSVVSTSLGCGTSGIVRTYDATAAASIASTTGVRFVAGAHAYDDPRKVELEFPEGTYVPNEGVVRVRHSEAMIGSGVAVMLGGMALDFSAAACPPDSGGITFGPGGHELCVSSLVLLGSSLVVTGLIVLLVGLEKHAYVDASAPPPRPRSSFRLSAGGLGVSF